jgi:hypothetical protein
MNNSNGGGRRRRLPEALLASLAVSGVAVERAQAMDMAYGFGYVAEHSNNVARAPSAERSDWIDTLLAGAALRENTSELMANVVAQAQASAYRDDAYEDTTHYFLDAAGVWTISPGRLTWTAEDHYTQVKRDAAVAGTPENLVDANAFDTGPDWFVRFGAAETLVLGGRYGEVYYSEGEADNERVTGYARWLHGLDTNTTLSLNLELLDVDYQHDSAINIDYRRSELFLRYDLRQARSHYVLDLGASRIERDRVDDVDGSLIRLTWSRELTSQSRFGLTGAREYGDAGTLLLSTVTDPAAPADPTTPSATDIATPDVYYVKRLEMFYQYTGSDMGFGLQLFGREFDYLQTPQDRQELGGHVDLGYNVSAQLTTTLYVDTTRTEYLNVVRDDDDRTVGWRLRYQATRNLSLALEGSQVERRSTLDGVEFTERRYLFGLYYSSGPLYVPARR